ncbi:protein of unknown function DUF448 [Thermodesulfatator indicus DSM 15286]|uniref:YlxR domain-containing protein n=1 Tax=Thermodesulfatator indicus (strain DSM 15286 / JCM 11887 / CIR29812) TaxID=667014 RepID=F8A9F6_THEID|nr:YlxR family protein [Thermodesulfatator indicus]AEH44097.1 protein of unknown function DUF448 [Thermodesulfatator indicus DSM 15286]
MVEKKRHVPQRSCIICKKKTAKHKLLRLALDERGRVVLDVKAKRPGRGAYVCPSDACVAKLLTKHGEKRLRWAFKGKAKEITPKTIDEILVILKGATREHE